MQSPGRKWPPYPRKGSILVEKINPCNYGEKEEYRVPGGSRRVRHSITNKRVLALQKKGGSGKISPPVLHRLEGACRGEGK